MKLNTSNIWFTSDTHYNHTNICRGVSKWDTKSVQTRDFPDLEHMNSTLVNNINSCVGQDDILFHLGDWSFGGIENIAAFRNRIICREVHLILGNHDHHIKRNKENTQDLFASVSRILDLEVVTPEFRRNFMLHHFPVISWEDMSHGVIHLHGHIHLPKRLRLRDGKSMDVGVDGNDLMPHHIKDIVKIMDKQPIAKSTLPFDHH